MPVQVNEVIVRTTVETKATCDPAEARCVKEISATAIRTPRRRRTSVRLATREFLEHGGDTIVIATQSDQRFAMTVREFGEIIWLRG